MFFFFANTRFLDHSKRIRLNFEKNHLSHIRVYVQHNRHFCTMIFREQKCSRNMSGHFCRMEFTRRYSRDRNKFK